MCLFFQTDVFLYDFDGSYFQQYTLHLTYVAYIRAECTDDNKV